MMRAMVEVVSPGFLSTVQDLGRPGWTHLGISPGGAADRQALIVGNRLIGNAESAAAIEMTMVGGNFRFAGDVWIAVTGGRCSLTVDGVPMTSWYAFQIRTGQTLRIGSIEWGVRAYLCIFGGIDEPCVLGSRATFLSGNWGGHRGRKLEAGDRLEIGDSIAGVPASRRAPLLLRKLYETTEPLRVTRGRQWTWLTDSAQHLFFESEYEVTSEADRKGLRLQGPGLPLREMRELLTEGVANGTVQIPANGQPLLLFCEQQTTGGYPKVATVIQADLFRLGQLRPGEKIRFKEVSLEEAWEIDREREKLCRRLSI